MTDHIPSAIHHLTAGADPWAMDTGEIMSLVERGQSIFDRVFAAAGADDVNALEAYRAARAERGKRLGVRGSVGILYVTGPLMKRDSWITGLLGLTTYETLRRDLQVMLDEPRLKSLILHIDSPGGEANGVDELATAIYAARGRKPITAYVSGTACSAAYWIASAADRIVVSDLAVLGSIGVVLAVSDRRKASGKAGVVHKEFVSSQSPGKRPDINTVEGLARVQKMVDDLGNVFVAAVAKYRGVSTQAVTSKFGAGGVEIGAKAVKAGMADEVGQFENVLAKMQSQAKPAAKASAQAATDFTPSLGATASSAEYRPVAPQPTAEEQARAAAVARAKRQEEIDASWRRAAARTNAGLNLPAEASADDETAGVEPAKPPLAGWQKAAAEANKRFGNL